MGIAVGGALAAGGVAAVVPVVLTVAVGTGASLALGHVCLKTFEMMDKISCFQNFRWYCYPLVAAAGGECAGAGTLAIASGAILVNPELFDRLIEYGKKLKELTR